MTFDYDWIVVGSGFGGSVAAHRLTEKGYRVAVIECGRRFADDEYAASAWDFRKFFWAPRLGMHGILRLTAFRDIYVVSGSAVGGGSAVYANTLYRAKREFYDSPQWAALDDWHSALAPHYAEAERMLGVRVVPFGSDQQELLKGAAEELGVAGTFTRTPVGVYFGAPGETVPDPYFGGEGPPRTGCTRCGGCMMGCRVGAKNTLLKNYLWLAERGGARIVADSEVVQIRPLGDDTGRDGFRVDMHRSGAWFGGAARTLTARGVVVAAGALGTNRLLAKCKLDGALPRLSDRLGALVRTNSEAIHAVRTGDGALKTWNDVAISASIHPAHDTHIELVTFGRHADAVGGLLMPLIGEATGMRAVGALLGALLLHPIQTLRAMWPVGWSRRSFFVLAMQSVDNAIHLRARRGLFGGVRLTSEVDAARPLSASISIARTVTRWLAKRTGGTAQTGALEVLLGIPTTAHLLGGAVIGRDASTGVIDAQQRVFGYENLIVCDGAAVPANPGVNPALTITAMAERAMTFIPAAHDNQQ